MSVELGLGKTAKLPQLPGLQKNQLWSISGAHMFNDLMTVGIVPALLPIYKEAFHLTYTQAGLIVLISYLVSSVMQPVFGFLTDRHPRVWLLPTGVFLTGAGLALTGIAPSFNWLLLAIGISGLGSGVFHPEASRSAHLAAGNERGKGQAIFQVGGNFGQALGPLMLPLFIISAGLKGMWWFWLFGSAGALLVARIVPWYGQSLKDRMAKKKKQGVNRYWAMGLLIVVVIFRSWAQVGVSGFLPFYYQHHNMPLSQAELYTFLFLGAGALGTFIGGVLSDKISRKYLLLGSMIVTIPFAFLLPHVSGLLAVIVLFLFGFTILSSFAITVVYAQMLLPGNIGLASGLTIGLGVGAGGIGATIMGAIADSYGVGTVLSLFGIFPILAAIAAAFIPNDQKLQD